MNETECSNPNNNPNCKKIIFTKKGLCRSCMLSGRSYQDIYGEQNAQIQIDNQFLEEIKPDALLEYSFNQLKISAGYEYCKNNNLEFRIINDKILNDYIEKALKYHETNNN